LLSGVVPTIGTRGDVQPYVALALGLTEASHTVIVPRIPVCAVWSNPTVCAFAEERLREWI